jgi:hypothetical protein
MIGWNEARLEGCSGFNLAARAEPFDEGYRQFTAWDFEL